MKDIDQIPLTEFVGNLQTYEMGLGSMGKGGKSKNLALKGIEDDIKDFEDEDESEDEDEDDDEDEVPTFITNEIIKLLQFRKKDKGKPPSIEAMQIYLRIKWRSADILKLDTSQQLGYLSSSSASFYRNLGTSR